jgi:hypothetical protein
MKKLFSAGLFSLIAWGAAQAQQLEVSVLGGYPLISRAPLGSLSTDSPKDDDTKLKGSYTYGARLTWNTKGYYGNEVGFTFNRATLRTTLRDANGVETLKQDRIVIHHAFYNFLIYFMPAGERWRPFVTGGAQIQQYGAPHIPEWTVGHSRNYGANYGGGIKLKLFKHALMRFDFRDYIGGKPYDLTFKDETKSGGIFRQWEGSIGLAITFW